MSIVCSECGQSQPDTIFTPIVGGRAIRIASSVCQTCRMNPPVKDKDLDEYLEEQKKLITTLREQKLCVCNGCQGCWHGFIAFRREHKGTTSYRCMMPTLDNRKMGWGKCPECRGEILSRPIIPDDIKREK